MTFIRIEILNIPPFAHIISKCQILCLICVGTFGSDFWYINNIFLRTNDTRSPKCATFRLYCVVLRTKVNKHQKMIETHDGGNMQWREERRWRRRLQWSHLTSSFTFLLFSAFINRYKFVCIHLLHYYIYNIHTFRRWFEAKMSQPTVNRLWFVRSAHNMTKEIGGDVDDNGEARVSFIYHFNIYSSSSSSSPLSNGKNQKANNTE